MKKLLFLLSFISAAAFSQTTLQQAINAGPSSTTTQTINITNTGTFKLSTSSTYSVYAGGLHTIGSPTVALSGLVGVGTTAPAAKLNVVSTSTVTPLFQLDNNSDLRFKVYPTGQVESGVGTNNLHIGFDNGLNRTTGASNTTIGRQAGRNITSSSYNTGIGEYAVGSITSGVGECTAIGYYALAFNTTGFWNFAGGVQAMRLNTTGERNVAVGHVALENNLTNSYCSAVGAFALRSSAADFNTGMGYGALEFVTNGFENAGFGNNTLYNGANGDYNTAIGSTAGFDATGDRNIFIGAYAGRNFTGSNAVYIGSYAQSTLALQNSRSIIVMTQHASDSSLQEVRINAKVGINTGSPSAKLHVVGTSTVTPIFRADSATIARFILYPNGRVEAGGAQNYNNNTFYGFGCGEANTVTGVGEEGLFNTGFGFNALKANTTGLDNMAFGQASLIANTSGNSNVAISVNALGSNTTGQRNIAIGVQNSSENNGSENTSVGYQTMLNATGASSNAVYGRLAGYSLAGSENTLIGTDVGFSNTSANRNIHLGYRAGFYHTTEDDIFSVNNQDRADKATEIIESILYGVMDANPANQSLSINVGTLKLAYTGTPGNGKVFTSDANGLGSWSASNINTTAGDAATVQGTSGRFRKDVSGSTFVLTNSLITTSSIIMLTGCENTTAVTATFGVASGTGDCTITFYQTLLGVLTPFAPSSNQDMNFFIIN